MLLWSWPTCTLQWIMTYWKIRDISEVVEQSHLKLCMCVYVCMYPLALNQQTFDRLNGIISKIYLIS